jgi:intein/homing endonuclease
VLHIAEEPDFWKSLDGLLMRIDLLAQNLAWKSYNEAMQETLRFEGVTWVEWVSDYTQDPARGPCLYCDSQSGRRYRLGQFLPSLPHHPNCLPGNALVSSSHRITGATKRAYDGNVLIIQTATGDPLSVTPNHPILTPHGWVPASFLNKGSYVVCQRRSESILSSNGNHQQMPTPIENVANAFLMMPTTLRSKVPTAAKDFHGDGRNGEVAIVGTNRHLMPNRDASVNKHLRKLAFMERDAALMGLHSLGQLQFLRKTLLSTTSSIMSRTNLCSSLLGIHLAPFQESCFMATTDRYVGLNQTRSNRSSVDLEVLRNLLLRDAGNIFFDEIVDVGWRKFHGHIYNLETSAGYFNASDIIVSNCKCDWAPILPTEEEYVRKGIFP